jgi:hypothetical protein
VATFWRGFDDPDGISDWTEVPLTSGHTYPAWSVVSTNQLQATSASSHNTAFVWDDIDADGDRDDFEVLCQVYVDSTSTTARYLGGRISTSGSSRTGYAVRVRSNSIDTYRFNGSTYTAITNGVFSVTSGTWCWVRFRVNGSTVQARVWADGDSEPGTWQCSATDTTYATAGHVGAIKGANTSTQLWRRFGVGTNGDTAPSSSGGTDGTITGATLTATASLIPGALSGTSSATIAGTTMTAAASLVPGALQAGSTIAGQTLSATASLIPGTLIGEGGATLAGQTLSATASLIPGELQSTGNAQVLAGTTLSVASSIIVGELRAGSTLPGQTLTASASLIPGVLFDSSLTSGLRHSKLHMRIGIGI